MPGKVAKIGTFSDWIGLFDDWRKDIGVNHDEIANFKFDTLYGAIETDEIQFGAFKGVLSVGPEFFEPMTNAELAEWE